MYFLFYSNTLSITEMISAKLVEMKLVRTQCPMAGQHLHARHDHNRRKGKARQSTCFKVPACQLPFTDTLAITTPPLADRWPGKCILQEAWKAKGLALDISFQKTGQPSRLLHERRIKYIPTKTQESGRACSRAERLISVAAAGGEIGIYAKYWLEWHRQPDLPSLLYLVFLLCFIHTEPNRILIPGNSQPVDRSKEGQEDIWWIAMCNYLGIQPNNCTTKKHPCHYKQCQWINVCIALLWLGLISQSMLAPHVLTSAGGILNRLYTFVVVLLKLAGSSETVRLLKWIHGTNITVFFQ